jgi:hypothetical protein
MFCLPPCSVVLVYNSPIMGPDLSHPISLSDSAALCPDFTTRLERSFDAKSRRLYLNSIVSTKIKFYQCLSKFFCEKTFYSGVRAIHHPYSIRQGKPMGMQIPDGP